MSNAYIYNPVGIAAYSPTDYIFGEWNCHTIRRVTNGIVRRVAGTAWRGGGYCCDGGPATSAYIVHPGHLSLDKDKQGFYFPGELQSRGLPRVRPTLLTSHVLMYTEWGSHRVRYVNKDGYISTVANVVYPHGVVADSVGGM